MRMIGTLAADREAARFGDYLLTLGMPNNVEQSETTGQWDVWVERDDDLERAAAELAAFQANPDDPRFVTLARQANSIRRDFERAEARRRKKFVDVRTSWSQPAQWNIPFTLLLIVLSVLVAVFTGLGHRLNDLENLLWINSAIDTPAGVMVSPYFDSIRNHYQYWRLITPIFLHFNILHILFNMLWLRQLGGLIEKQKGTWFLVVLVIFIAALSNLTQYLLPPHNPFFGGMSGVVFGLFGYVWLTGLLYPGGNIGISRENAILMFIWLAVCCLGIVSQIANGVHVAGLIVGLAFGYVPYATKRLMR